MLTTIAAALLCAAAAQEPQDTPATKELFAKEEWYRNQQGKEQQFVGVLKKAAGGGGIGIGRFNPYRLEQTAGGKTDVREVYVGGKPALLAPYVGKKVRITGKAVEIEVVGRIHREIWPARIEIVTGEKGDADGGGKGVSEKKQLKVFAKGLWRYFPANPDGDRKGKQYVIREAKELANLPPWNQLDGLPEAVGRAAAQQIAKELKVKDIDWSKQMLIIVSAGVRPTGGWKVDIERITVDGQQAVVTYRITAPKGIVTQAFTHPAVVALVERFNGEVRFHSPAAPGGRPVPKRR